MVKQHLRALLSQGSVEATIQDLDAYFIPLLDSLKKDKVAEYHLYRGMIHLHYDCFNDATIDFENALANEYDPIVGKLNLAIAKYHSSIAEIPRDQRILLPSLKMKPMLEAEKLLIDIIQTLKGNPDSVAIMNHAVSFYVSACALIGKPHQLTPISEYLCEEQSYESKRAIIMGSPETLTEEEIGMLSSEDALFCTIREMLRQNKVQECKQHLAALVDSCDPSISPPAYNSLLQACLLLDSPDDYWYYRTSAEHNGINGDLLKSYDAWAYDLDGKTETAKTIIDEISENSYDDGLLFNALQFYARNNMLPEQEMLLLRMHDLQRTRQIYIVNLDDFYGRLTDFFVRQKFQGFAQLLSEFPEKALTRGTYLRMQGKYYSEVNDLDKLISCLSELWSLEHNFTHGFDLAICLYRAMRYEEAIAIGIKLEATAPPEKKTLLYWLLSDAYLLNNDSETSFNWAKKAHEAYFVNGTSSLRELLSWVRTTNSITLVEDGFVDSESLIATAFSNNFVSCCNISHQKKIPYLYYDQIAPKFQHVPEFGVPDDVQFVMIPSVCFNNLKAMPDKLATALYGLLKYCSFVSFTSDTIVQIIRSNNDVVTSELIEPFMCCNSNCDMTSFANVYLGAIQIIRQTNKDAALQLSQIVLANAKKVWRRGTAYRIAYEDYNDIPSGMKAKVINQYLQMLIHGINSIYSTLPMELGSLLLDLKECLK